MHDRENHTLSSGTSPSPSIWKCPPPRARFFFFFSPPPPPEPLGLWGRVKSMDSTAIFTLYSVNTPLIATPCLWRHWRRAQRRVRTYGVSARESQKVSQLLSHYIGIGFPGQFRNFVAQMHFMSFKFRRFGSCTTDGFVIRFHFPSIRICINANQI